MQVTTPDGRTFTETDQQALAYYRHEPGYQVSDDAAVPAPVADAVEVPVEGVSVDGDLERPATSASKRDWYDYAGTVDEHLPAYEDITHAELVDKYGVAD